MAPIRRRVLFRRCAAVLGVLLASGCAGAEPQRPGTPDSAAASPRVVFDDIDAFWSAYDLVRATSDSVAQVRVIETDYIGRGSAGLRAFMQARDYTAEEWVGSIRRHPRFWDSIRPNTLRAEETQGIDAALAELRALYPQLRPATIYFTIGALRSGGTTQDSMVLIGAELATGMPGIDISEFDPGTQSFLTRYFASEPLRLIVPLTVHEYVHTQQTGLGETVLARAIREGSADLVTELVTGTRMPLPYMTQGPAREPLLRETFRAQMFTRFLRSWFYNQTSTDPDHVPDLGYYMGYAIARSYYERAEDKADAIRALIELPFDDHVAVLMLLESSGYYPDGFDEASSSRAYEEGRPVVVGVDPIDGDGTVDASTTELRIRFSAPMAAYSGMDVGTGGRAEYPVTERVGFSADRRSYVVRVSLEPGRRYGFVLEGSELSGFRSENGFALRQDTITFTTTSRADR